MNKIAKDGASLLKETKNGTINLTVLGDSTKTDSTKIKTKEKDKKEKGGGIIIPNAPICGIMDKDYWIFDHYSPNPGKIIGIYPTTERFTNLNRLAEIKNKWGFNYILTSESYLNNVSSTTVGYTNSNIVLGIDVFDSYWSNVILNHPAFYGYYVDEPVTRHDAFSAVQMMQLARNFISSNRPSSKFIGGEVLVPEADVIDHLVDIVTCTRYCIDGDYFCFYPDQRPLWSDFKTSFPSKFSFVWLAAHKDLSEYDKLLERANILGISQIWLYQELDNTDIYSDNNINSFTMYAWKWGYFSRIENQWIYTYECTKQNPCDCDRNILNDGWELVSKFKTSISRSVAY